MTATAGETARSEAQAGAAPPGRARSRLFRKYVVLIALLVGGALTASGALEIWFSYGENKAALARLQKEKAVAAAARIDQFIDEITRQVGWTTRAQWSPAVLEQRRIEYLQLLRQAPAVTEVAHLDAQGREDLRVSRLAMDSTGSRADFSNDPRFLEAKARKTWFSPVYFRKESEPYITLAIAGTGRDTGVTVAEVNLKFIWDVISRIKVGQAGYAYVVDSRGLLIAHPDIGLVLRKTDLKSLPQVAAALAAAPAGADDEEAIVGADQAGRQVLTANATIKPVDWFVFVDLPISEALEPVYDSARRTAILILLGLGFAIAAAVFLARRMVVPIQALQEGAARIGAGDLARRIEIRTGDELEALADRFNRMAADLQESYAGLERKVEERTHELSESLQQQTATADVLKVISRSAFDLQTVLDTLVESAARLCQADMAQILRPAEDAATYLTAASYGNSPEFVAYVRTQRFPIGRGSVTGRVLLEGKPVQVADVAADPEYELREIQRIGGYRTHLGVPMLREGKPIGVLLLSRNVVRPFDGKQIELVTTFADQAVIAIENVRLLTEVRESLEQQTATAEVLKVISRSPFDLEPVLQNVLDTAAKLAGAQSGWIGTSENGVLRVRTGYNLAPGAFEDLARRIPEDGRGSAAGRALLDGRTWHIPDTAADPDYTEHDLAASHGFRCVLAVPLVREGQTIGVIALRRPTPQFNQRQIELVETFADQAVIAVENNRLLSELRESLEQQTATAEVLKVISRSPFDLEPVLQNLLETAAKLADTEIGVVSTLDGERMVVRAGLGMSKDFYEEAAARMPSVGRGWASGRALIEGKTCHIPDIRTDADYTNRDVADKHGYSTALAVPLMREGRALGVITLLRREVRPYTPREIELVETFADQAVIAVENNRLLSELRETLEQQTATAEVLKVISSSPFDLDPVLQNLLETSAKLADTDKGWIGTYDNGELRVRAGYGMSAEFFAEAVSLVPASGRGSSAGRALLDGRTCHVVDTRADPEYTIQDFSARHGYRTALAVPLMREGKPIGVIALIRTQVRPFSPREIELTETFADQAAIAVANVKLFDTVQARTRELTESLEQQTATAEVLKVISSSPFDLDPVLQTLIETAMRLAGADHAWIGTLAGEGEGTLQVRAGVALPRAVFDSLARLIPREGRGSVAGRALADGKTVQIADVLEDPDHSFRGELENVGIRTVLAVPLLREGRSVGVMALTRATVAPFDQRSIELVQTFADQAVIAIANVRLFDELQARTTELARSVEELKALGEVGRAVSSTLDLRTVLDTVVARAIQLGEADGCSIYRYKPKTREFLLWHAVGLDPSMETGVRALHIGEDQTVMGKAVHTHELIQVPDLSALPPAPLRDLSIAAGYRAVLVVPLVRADRIFGALVLQRRRIGEFQQSTVNLLRTFASQSSLAIQNARLFREIEEKGRQIELASQHKSQFMANMSHELRTPLNAILGYTELMLDGLYGDISDKARSVLERVQSNGKHLLGLINDVLDLAKIEAGQLTLAIGDYAVDQVVRSVIDATESLARAKGLALTAEVAPSLPPGTGDERRLTQVLLNVVGNAIKFTDAGSVTIAARAEDGFFTIAVADTGPGIPESERARIFEEFQQVDNSSTRKKGGTGLGLAISRRIVEMHGGTITVESTLGQGSTFLIHLPVLAARAKEVA